MTVLWIILAAIAAAFLALFQYGYIFSSKKNTKRKPWFALLRFLTVFAILLLFIGPKFNKTTYETIKPLLLVQVDNTASIAHLKVKDQLLQDYNDLINHPEIKERFDIKTFQFSDQVNPLNSLDFKATETDIHDALTQPQELFNNRNKALVVLTDGNQTQGNSYQYTAIDSKTAVYPIIYGDTTQYPDLKITQLNVNRYSYLNNEFPVEVFTNHIGDQPVTTQFKITSGNTTLFQQQISFSREKPSQTITANLTSKNVGTQSMRAVVTPLNAEKNTANNYRNFAVEVIDQQTKILILSDIMHPDLGALKKAIASNQQRDVEIKTTSDSPDLNDYNMVIFYSPNSAFAKAYQQASQLNKNTWTITGPSTDYSFLNSRNTAFNIELDDEYDDAQPILNTSYTSFNLEEYSYDDYPPVRVPFGAVTMNTAPEILMYKMIGNVETQQPLWFTYEQNESRHAVLLADGLWRWRAQSYLDEKEFKNWDELVSSQVQYLASNKRRNRLELDYKTFYYQNKKIIINAQYLDKNYEFEDNGIINIHLVRKSDNKKITRPFILESNNYTVDLSGLDAGDYRFTVKVENDQLSRSGSLSILEFDVEKQFISAQDDGMKQLVGNDQVYYQGNLKPLMTSLKNNTLLKPVERASVQYASLIDWEYLLGIILFLLGLEWFLRKYNGLI